MPLIGKSLTLLAFFGWAFPEVSMWSRGVERRRTLEASEYRPCAALAFLTHVLRVGRADGGSEVAFDAAKPTAVNIKNLAPGITFQRR